MQVAPISSPYVETPPSHLFMTQLSSTSCQAIVTTAVCEEKIGHRRDRVSESNMLSSFEQFCYVHEEEIEDGSV